MKIRRHERKGHTKNGKAVAATTVNKNNPESTEKKLIEKKYRNNASKKASSAVKTLAQENSDQQIQESRYGIGAFEAQQKAETMKKDLEMLKNYDTNRILALREGTLTRNNPQGKILSRDTGTQDETWEKYAPEPLKEAKRRVQQKIKDDLTQIMNNPDIVVDLDLDSFEAQTEGQEDRGDEVSKLKGQFYVNNSDTEQPEIYEFEYEQRHSYIKPYMGQRVNFPNENARENYSIHKNGEPFKKHLL